MHFLSEIQICALHHGRFAKNQVRLLPGERNMYFG